MRSKEMSEEEKKEAGEKAWKQYDEVIDSLVEFVKYASKEGAPPEAISVLPQVAEVVLNKIW